jgi:hypothetical protein
MDKQEMVCQCGHTEEYHDKKSGCVECRCSKFSVPAQPELPRELPLIFDEDGNYIADKIKLRQCNADQLILNKWIEAYDIALERIARLEADMSNALRLIKTLNDGYNELDTYLKRGEANRNSNEPEYKIITKGHPFTLREIK